jgi:hypothetical protein
MERVIRDAPKPVVEHSQVTGAKRRDFGFLTRRPPLPKKGESGQSSGQFQRRSGSFTQKDLDRLVEEDSDVTILLDSFTHNYLVFCLFFYI